MSADSCGTQWFAVVSGPLARTTPLAGPCGLGVGDVYCCAADIHLPPTSIWWGWRDGGGLLRARIDGDAAFVAELNATEVPEAGGAVGTVPWDGRTQGCEGARVPQVRKPGLGGGGAGVVYEQVVVDGICDGVGPITSIRPARG